MLHNPFSIGVTDSRWVRHDTVVLKCGCVNGIERGFVQVGLDDAFLEVVQDYVAATTTEIAPCLFMQSCPGFLAGLPHDSAKAISTNNTGERTFTVVDLALLTWGKFESIKLFRLMLAQATGETFDAVVGTGKSMAVDQILVDRHVVSLEAQLSFDESALGLAIGDCCCGAQLAGVFKSCLIHFAFGLAKAFKPSHCLAVNYLK